MSLGTMPRTSSRADVADAGVAMFSLLSWVHRLRPRSTPSRLVARGERLGSNGDLPLRGEGFGEVPLPPGGRGQGEGGGLFFSRDLDDTGLHDLEAVGHL